MNQYQDDNDRDARDKDEQNGRSKNKRKQKEKQKEQEEQEDQEEKELNELNDKEEQKMNTRSENNQERLNQNKDSDMLVTNNLENNQLNIPQKSNIDSINIPKSENTTKTEAHSIEAFSVPNDIQVVARTRSEKEEVKIAKRFIVSYFSVFKSQLKDQIQKCVVCNFFEEVQHMQSFINHKLKKNNIIYKDLLSENEYVVKERKRLKKSFNILTDCLSCLNKVSNYEDHEFISRVSSCC